MNARINEIIDEMRSKLVKYDEKLQPPASEDQIEVLVERTRTELKAELPPEYLDLLRTVNGIIWDNLYFYPSEESPRANDPAKTIQGFIEANLENRSVIEEFNNWLVFGNSGNMDTYIQDLETGKFQILDHLSLSLTKSFDTFDELMVNLLEYNL